MYKKAILLSLLFLVYLSIPNNTFEMNNGYLPKAIDEMEKYQQRLERAGVVSGASRWGQIFSGCPRIQKGNNSGGGKTIPEGEIVDSRGVFESHFFNSINSKTFSDSLERSDPNPLWRLPQQIFAHIPVEYISNILMSCRVPMPVSLVM